MCQSRASCLPCQLDPWLGFFRTPQSLTVIALRAVSVLMNFVTFHPTTMGNGMIEGISGYDTLVHSQSFGSLASSTNRLNFVCSFHFTYQSQSFSSPVWSSIWRKGSPEPQFFAGSNSPSLGIRPVWTRPDEFLHHFAPRNYKG